MVKRRLKNLATVVVMGVPAWVVVAGLLQDRPATLVVRLEEPGVEVWVNDRAYPANGDVVGPLGLEPGVCRACAGCASGAGPRRCSRSGSS